MNPRHSARPPSSDRWFDSFRNGFALFGLLAVIILVLEIAQHRGRQGGDDLSDTAASDATAEVKSGSLGARLPEPGQLQTVPHRTAPAGASVGDPRQQAIARHVARSYRIALEAADEVVTAAFDAARRLGLDPLVVLAVIAVESRFNPIAESEMGAKGLMQVIPRFHLDKLGVLGGLDMILKPGVNVMLGAQILREYVGRAGSLEAGLQWYNGSPNDENRTYADKVLAERDRLAQVASASRAAAQANATMQVNTTARANAAAPGRLAPVSLRQAAERVDRSPI